MDELYNIALHNVLSDKYGRYFIMVLLRDCGIDLTGSISYRTEKTAHELGLDLLQKIMYNEINSLGTIISEQRTMEVTNGRGSRDSDND